MCDAAIVAGHAPALEAARGALEELAAALGGARFAVEAAGVRALATGAPPEHLERLVTVPDGPARRRARYLLGEPGAADAIDRVVLGALGRRPARLALIGAPGAPGWGLDRGRQLAWLPSGATVDLAAKPQLWRLLELLAEHPDGISRAALANRLWPPGKRPPNPTKLLHNLVFKLRKLLDAAAHAPRVATTDEGYRLADDLALRIFD
jgi:hypothetical protein